jgi:hypothetical protein
MKEKLLNFLFFKKVDQLLHANINTKIENSNGNEKNQRFKSSLFKLSNELTIKGNPIDLATAIVMLLIKY